MKALNVKAFISMLILSGLVTSCAGGNTTPQDTKVPTDGSETTTSVGSSSYTDDQREYWEPLASENLGGEFRVAVKKAGKFYVQEESGDIINDAIYQRNLAVETLYNVTMKEIVAEQSTVQASILAADDSYDVYFVPLYRQAAQMATAGLLTNVNEIDSISLDSVWWDQNLIETTTIAGKNFYLAGDIDYTLYGRTIALFFNKPKMAEVSDEDIYKLVSDGKWTISMLDKLQRNATRDLNGDTVMDDKDSYGIINSSVHSLVLFAASGGRIVTNNDGNFELTMNSPRNAEAITKIFEVTLGASEYCFNTDTTTISNKWERIREMFRNDQALLQSTVLYNAINQRSMESDFGILPYPKLDEAQESYYSTSFNDNYIFVIPKSVKDVERVGKIMNALAFEGRFTVKQAFYDEALGTKFIRDEESKEMLDIIFDNVIFDVGFIYNINGLGDLLNNMHKAGNDNFASEYAKIAVGAEVALEDLIELISDLG